MKLKGTAITEAFINYIVKNFNGKSQEVSQEQIGTKAQLKIKDCEIEDLAAERDEIQAKYAALSKN